MVTDEKPKVLCLMGPTGIGKSALALELAHIFPAEIVSVDSAMIYRGMDIGTAKPSHAERASIPHHLLDIRDPSEPYSAAEFADDATQAIAGILERGRLPILVGGTFLYFRALSAGLSPMPAADPELRANIRAQAEQVGWEALHAELARLDPAAATRIHPRDHQRLERALELCRLSGKPASRLHETAGAGANFDFVKIALFPTARETLAKRLEARFHAMLAAGFADEVRALHERGDLSPRLPAMRALGYRQLWAWFEGECAYDEAVCRAVVATRRYAKRQLTWLRAEPDCEPLQVNFSGTEPLPVAALKAVCEKRLHVRMTTE